MNLLECYKLIEKFATKQIESAPADARGHEYAYAVGCLTIHFADLVFYANRLAESQQDGDYLARRIKELIESYKVDG